VGSTSEGVVLVDKGSGIRIQENLIKIAQFGTENDEVWVHRLFAGGIIMGVLIIRFSSLAGTSTSRK
jgi:hypothetical protein